MPASAIIRGMLEDSLLQYGPHLFAAFAIGALVGWMVRSAHVKRLLRKSKDEWHVKFDEAIHQRDRFNAENNKLRTSIEAQQAVVHKHELAASKMRTELESVREKNKLQLQNLFTIGAERDQLQSKVNHSDNALRAVNQQRAELEAEFIKAGNFYKGELEKSFDQRKALKAKLEDARLEHESLRNLLDASQSEKESVNKMLVAAQTRLDNLDLLEQKVIELEAENAQLRHDATRSRQEIEVLRRDVAELDELKVQNRELAHCLTSMENSRKQYERDAKRYREQANQSEKQSETLRMKLDDVEKSFADMAKEHDHALDVARRNESAKKTNGQQAPEQEVDDLTEIVGIGKVFQQTLNELGIYSFQQIAAFGPADIARVNMELKEFKGRMEQDDWIGQAKALQFKKYGSSD